MELTTVGAKSFIAIILGMTLSFVIPIVVALIWKIKKKERTSTILVGAATFLLFALILDQSQNLWDRPHALKLRCHSLWRGMPASLSTHKA